MSRRVTVTIPLGDHSHNKTGAAEELSKVISGALAKIPGVTASAKVHVTDSTQFPDIKTQRVVRLLLSVPENSHITVE